MSRPTEIQQWEYELLHLAADWEDWATASQEAGMYDQGGAAASCAKELREKLAALAAIQERTP